MTKPIQSLAVAILVSISLSGSVSGQAPTPVQVDGTGGARTSAQTRPPDSRRPRGTAVALLGWKAGIRSDAFGAIPFSDAAAKIDAAGVAFVEGVSTNLDYRLGAEDLAKVKSRLAELGLHVSAYRIDSLPADEASRRKLLDFAKTLEIELILTRQPPLMSDLPGVAVAVEDPRGTYKQGAKTVGANLHDAAKAAPFLLELSRMQPPEPPEWPNKCGDCGTSRPSVKPLFFTIDPGAAENYDKAVRVAEGYRVNAISRMLPITTADKIPADEKQRIDAAVPRQALVTPKKSRKLLIIDLCPAGGFYHTTIAHGNLMLQLIGKHTGAYEAIFDNNLDNLKYPHIKQYDAVFLNSVVGPVFADPDVLDGLIRYVREGGGVAGLHGTTFASQDVRDFGELMGAQEGPHQYNGEPGTLRIDDPNSPVTKHFGGKGFSMIDEFYHFPPTGPYTREKLHVLLSVDAEKTDLRRWQIRPDNDYGMVWIKSFGKGRVFNSVLGHRPEFYMNPDLVKMILGGIQFVLGDLEADTTPSANIHDHEHDHGAVDKVGTVNFETSCSAAAQPQFNRAVALLHSFEFLRAVDGFNATLATDRSCAIAEWGIALSKWSNPFAVGIRPAGQLQQGRDAVERARTIGTKTDRERAYVDAVSRLYADVETKDQAARVAAYRDAMSKLASEYPNDTEASIFYALSLAAAASPADKTFADQLKAGAILEKLIAGQPDHPGLAHYIIHSYDLPPLADRALEAAQRYSKIAPSAPHALHMPSHTFTRLGHWQESIDANVASAAAAKRDGSAAEELHAMDYQIYAYLQTAQDRRARLMLDSLSEVTARFDPDAVGSAAPGSAGVFALAAIPARYALERGAWADAAKLEPHPSKFIYTDALTYFARAIGAAHLGDTASVRASIEVLQTIQGQLAQAKEAYWAEQVEIQRRAASAWLAFAERREADALAGMREAATVEDATEKSAVTPGPLAPARELLGEMLLSLNQPAQARKEFEATLTKEPNRFRAVYGAAHAASLMGDRVAARRYYDQLLKICERADVPGRPEMAEARRGR